MTAAEKRKLLDLSNRLERLDERLAEIEKQLRAYIAHEKELTDA